MTDNSNSGPRFPKVAKTNYVEWAGDVTAHLMTVNLEEFINLDDPPVEPVKTEVTDNLVAIALYLAKRKKAAGILYGVLDQDNRVRITNKDAVSDPVKIWKILKEHFQSASNKNQARAYLKFTELLYSNLESYITDTQHALASMLAVDGLKLISDSYLGETIVTKLPASMDITKTLLRKDQPLTPEKVLNYLESQLATIKDEESHANTVALAVRQPRTLQRSTTQRHLNFNRPNFTYCSNGRHNNDVRGHTSAECRQLNPSLCPARATGSRPRAASLLPPIHFSRLKLLLLILPPLMLLSTLLNTNAFCWIAAAPITWCPIVISLKATNRCLPMSL